MLVNSNPNREMQKNKAVIERIHKSHKQPVIASQKVQQTTIVNHSDLKELQNKQNRKSTMALIDMAGIIPKDSGLPKDLAQNHSKYTWEYKP